MIRKLIPLFGLSFLLVACAAEEEEITDFTIPEAEVVAEPDQTVEVEVLEDPVIEEPVEIVSASIEPGSIEDFIVNVNDKVYFDFDKSDLTADAMVTLEAQASWLNQYTGYEITVAGHADERGTNVYNFALGEKRANAAKEFLESNGIGSGRLSIISYGEENPAMIGSNEYAWQQNRRSQTELR